MKKSLTHRRSFFTRIKRFIAINIWVQKLRKEAFGKWYWYNIFYTIINDLEDTIDILLVGALLNEAQYLVQNSSVNTHQIITYFSMWFCWKLLVRITKSTYYTLRWNFEEYGFNIYLVKKVLRKLIHLRWSAIENARTQKLVRQTFEFSEYHIAELSKIQLEVCAVLISTIVGLSSVQIPVWILAIIMVKELPSVINNTIFASRTYKLNEETIAQFTQKDSIRDYFRNFSTLAEIKISNAHKKLVALFNEIQIAIKKRFWRKDVNQVAIEAVIDTGEVVVNAGIYLHYLLKVVYENLPFGSFQATTGIIRDIGNNFYRLMSRTTKSIDHFRYSAYAYDLFALEDKTHQEKLLTLDTDKIVIEFDHVTFRYPGAKKDALRDVSLRIEDNDRIALVGENGAGKSTFLKLLTLLYQPTSGQILINGVPLQNYDIESIYEKIAVVTQDFARYDVLTVAQNIGIYAGSSILDMDRVRNSAKLACAEELIEKLPNGYETILTKRIEDGVELSTGQWQRLAVARQFYANRPLVILDEPTSAIDPIAEAGIFNNLYEHARDKTVIVVSHRYNTVKAAKKILVFNDGQLIESGTHKELLAQNGYYAHAYEVQNEEKKL